MAGNVVFRGPIDRQPITKNLPVSGALVPGTMVEATATQLAQITTAMGKRPLVLGNVDFKDQDIALPYVSGDTGVAFEPQVNDVFNVRVGAATYTNGQELTIGAAGRLVAAAATNVVVAFYDDILTARSAGDLADVIWANYYIKA